MLRRWGEERLYRRSVWSLHRGNLRVYGDYVGYIGIMEIQMENYMEDEMGTAGDLQDFLPKALPRPPNIVPSLLKP